MILTNLTDTFTKDREVIAEEPIINGNIDVTIGGLRQSTSDVNLLEMTVEHFLSQTEWLALRAILYDFTKDLYYTPGRLLSGRTEIEPIKVVLKGNPKFKQILKDNSDVTEISYHVSMEFVEVLF